ncbi:MAG: BNR-4 repeat-containing protein, partial [Pirellulaceae bacterium]
WRETPDVETNHDLAYARSADGGKTWTRTDGSLCPPPITAATAEYAARIPQRSELANQTSMDTDDQGRPYIANFWREAQDAAPQYRIVFHRGEGWRTVQVGRREVDFRREGGGTKRSPVSRPRLLIDGRGPSTRAYLLFRDIERERRMSVASCENLPDGQWTIRDLTASSVGQADPLHDPIVWQQRREIHLFTQFVGQGDGETMEDLPPQMVSVVAWSPHP